jgi:hypothetical protein
MAQAAIRRSNFHTDLKQAGAKKVQADVQVN